MKNPDLEDGEIRLKKPKAQLQKSELTPKKRGPPGFSLTVLCLVCGTDICTHLLYIHAHVVAATTPEPERPVWRCAGQSYKSAAGPC